MKRRVHIREKVPDVPDDDAHDFVFGDVAVHNEAEAHQHPRQVRSSEYEDPQEAELRVWICPGPNIYESRRERMPEERQ